MSQESVNPFDDERLTFLVLINTQQQFSLWPEFAAIPAGWAAVFGPQSREACIGYTQAQWLDMRPAGVKTTSQA
ncbi:MbtH family protein [Musicola paradisiaca]|uniref:MbtH domain protein n=1 Tax=Musicola paradisiaca (strain Ech703) TaxID=579405 RepID=C6C328_MUSP7|nr:MbtH family protein [Musicola paradisiaca]ACS85293.1 MbtH domain protein [Musicola paradisiaca Ech703]